MRNGHTDTGMLWNNLHIRHLYPGHCRIRELGCVLLKTALSTGTATGTGTGTDRKTKNCPLKAVQRKNRKLRGEFLARKGIYAPGNKKDIARQGKM